MSQPWVYMCSTILNPHPPPSPPHSSGLSQSTSFGYPASCIKFELVIYFTYGNIHVLFQCYSLISSHPCLLPHSPKVCSLHLCLFCCHSGILAWEIPWTERNLLGYSPWGCKRVGHNLMTKQQLSWRVFEEKLPFT